MCLEDILPRVEVFHNIILIILILKVDINISIILLRVF